MLMMQQNIIGKTQHIYIIYYGGTATMAKGWELNIIAAVIIGGTSLMGGVGTVRGTLIGVIFLGVLVNGMTLLNISEYWQHVVRGVLILAAVLINRVQSEN